MRARDPLLGPVRARDDARAPGSLRARPEWRDRKGLWFTLAHLASLVAVLIGWEHLDVVWPTSLLPDGLTLGASRRVAGLLTIGDPGRPARFETSGDLVDDWRQWIRDDRRQETSECLRVPDALRARLAAGRRPRPGDAGQLRYWVEMDASTRLGPAMCGQAGGLQITQALDRIATLRPVSCSRDVFVAHGFACPLDRRTAPRTSETFLDQSDYYPRKALVANRRGKVRVVVDRDATGSPTACHVVTSSGNDLLDRQTCKLVGTDPGFTSEPAGRQGDRFAPLTQTVVWRLPDDKS